MTTATRLAPPPQRRNRRLLTPFGLPWILPALAVSVGLLYYCFGYTGVISTWNWDGVSPDPEFVGGANYAKAFQDGTFWAAIWHTVIFFIATFVAQTVLGLVFAVLLHSRVKFAVVYKVIVFVPVVLAPATMAPVFRQMYQPDGQFNWVLEHVGLGFLAQPWIGQSKTALLVVILVTIWQWTGLTFVLYYAGISQIDQSILEAARIDGAGNIRTLISIIWPGLRGTTIALAMLGLIGALKTFDVPFLVTGAVGGPNGATEFLGTYIYRMTIRNYHVGYGAAMSILLLVIAIALAIVLQRRGRDKELS